MLRFILGLTFGLSCLFTQLSFAKSGGDEQLARQIMQNESVVIFSDTCLVRKSTVGNVEYLHEPSSLIGDNLQQAISNELQQKKLINLKTYSPFHCGLLTKSEKNRVSDGMKMPVSSNTVVQTPPQIDQYLMSEIGSTVFQETFYRYGKNLILNKKFERANLGVESVQAEALKQQLGTPYVMLVQLYGNQPSSGKRLGSIALMLVSQGSSDVAVTGEYYVVSLLDLDQNKIIWTKAETVDIDFTGRVRPNLENIFKPLF